MARKSLAPSQTFSTPKGRPVALVSNKEGGWEDYLCAERKSRALRKKKNKNLLYHQGRGSIGAEKSGAGAHLHLDHTRGMRRRSRYRVGEGEGKDIRPKLKGIS